MCGKYLFNIEREFAAVKKINTIFEVEEMRTVLFFLLFFVLGVIVNLF